MTKLKPFFYYQTQQIKHVLVVGLGVSGVAVVEYLNTYALAIDIFDQDARNARLLVDYQNFDEIMIESYDLIVVAPGIPVNKAPFNRLHSYWHKVIGDIELFALHVKTHNDSTHKKQKIIAVTSSNGKSTVVSLLYHVLQKIGVNAALGGNIGIPALSLIDEKVSVYVLEISSFQIDLLKYAQFDVVAVLNLSPDHLDRYADYQTYCDAKLALLTRGAYRVMNAKQKDLLNHRADETFSYFNNDATYVDDDKAIFDNALFCQQSELILQGKHNLENILAVLVILDGLMILSEDGKARIQSAIANFNPLAHRCRLIKTFQGVSYINDSKATNIASTEAALMGLGNKDKKNIIILLGGVAKGADFSELIPVLKTYVKKALVYGRDRMPIYQAIANEVDCVLCEHFDEAFNAGITLACQNDLVLLSPACASFDGFLSYAHRGGYFEELVNKLR